jgi:hypothetical protein
MLLAITTRLPMICRGCLCLISLTALWFASLSPVSGQDYKLAKVDSPAPSGVAPEIASLLESTGFRVSKGSSAVCEVWLAKEWPIAADAKAGGEVIYPLTPGQLIGVIRYPRKAEDFRGQEIDPGTYVLRYAQQPIDGAHVGTSPTRDFLALSPVAKDRDAKTIDYKALVEASKEVSGTAHPAILSLQKEEGAMPGSIREVSEKEWVIVDLPGKAKQGSMTKDLPMGLVVVGKAAE